MMTLYSLLNEKRFVGCEDARQFCACFPRQDGCSMSLICRERDEGLHLVLRQGEAEVPASRYPLPHYVLERIRFWNAWASDELLNMCDRTESPLYGLEAYAISLAVDISAAYPGYLVDYCGFPVHDEWAVCSYGAKHRDSKKGWDAAFPLIPNAWKYNRNMQALLDLSFKAEWVVPPSGYRMRHDLDYCYSDIHFDRATRLPCWGGYEDSLEIDEAEGFPCWVVRHKALLEQGWDEDYVESPPHDSGWWSPSFYLRPFLEDALAIDIARYLKQPVPISSSPRYVTGAGLLEFLSRQR